MLLALLAVACCYFVYGFPLWGVGLRTQFERPASPAFFLGQVSSHGWWAYFPVAVLIKTPVGTLLLILASLVFPFAGTPLGRREAVFLLAPPALFLAGMAAGQVNLGLRYVLPIYPFLFVSASRLATVRSVAGVSGRWVPCVLVGLPLGLTAVSSLRVAPYQLTYFNEVAGGPERGYRYLGDSNLDWGQGLKGLKAYMERERLPMVYLSYFGTAPPAAYGIRYQYLPGFGQLQRPPSDHLPPGSEREILAISVTNLQGIYLPFPDLYSWLDSRTPLARIGNSIYVYDITGDADAHLQLAKLYLRTGLPHLARAELEKVLALSPAHPDAVELLSRELGTASEP